MALEDTLAKIYKLPKGSANPAPRMMGEQEVMQMRETNPMAGMMGSPGGMYADDVGMQMQAPTSENPAADAISFVQQSLENSTDPEEREGLASMIEKLQAQAMAPMGEMAQQLAQAGGGEDTMLAHLRPGEIVLPPEMMEDPEFETMVETKFNQLGINPEQAVAGIGIASLNESTGLEQFGFFKKIGKSLKKVVKKVAPLAVFVPGIGTALGGALGGLGGLATKGLAKVGLGGLGSALGSAGSALAGGIANLGIPGISSIAGGTAGGFGGITNALTTRSGLFGGGPLAGLLGGGQQPTIEEIGSADPSTQVRIDRLRSEGMSDAQIMQNLQQSGMVPQQAGGSSIFGGGTPGQSRIGMIEDLLKGRPSDPVRQGGMFGGGGQGGGMGGLAGLAGAGALAAGLGKLAYDEAKDAKGVSLSPVVAMDATG